MEKDQTDIIIIIAGGAALFLFLSVFIVIFLLKYWRKQSLHQKKISEMQYTFQQELLRTQLEIQEQTLKNISQEIHDNIGQTLSLAKLNLNTIDPQKENSVQKKIYNSKELVSKAIHDLRNLSKSLNTDSFLSGGLVKGIETELSMMEKAGIFHTQFNITGTSVHIDAKKELILFRIVQEAINNIIKHSNADEVKVKAIFENNFLKIIIRDNGKGFETAEGSEGSGLRNMHSRAGLIGGKFDVETNSNGTQISVTVPIAES